MIPLEVGNKSPRVRRITIDEIMPDGLMRILISELKPGRRDFDDNPDSWENEKDYLVTPDNYLEMMGIPDNLKPQWAWENFYEGAVFYQGAFLQGRRTRTPSRFRAISTADKIGFTESFISANSVIKDSVKEDYLKALKGGDENV